MEQLLLHLIGDYLTQTDWMASNKTKRWIPAIVHSFVYSVPFLLIGSLTAILVIFFTHLLIDRFRLVKYFLRVKEWRFDMEWGYVTKGEFAKPDFMWVWLMIISDNTIHLLINYFSLKYL